MNRVTQSDLTTAKEAQHTAMLAYHTATQNAPRPDGHGDADYWAYVESTMEPLRAALQTATDAYDALLTRTAVEGHARADSEPLTPLIAVWPADGAWHCRCGDMPFTHASLPILLASLAATVEQTPPAALAVVLGMPVETVESE